MAHGSCSMGTVYTAWYRVMCRNKLNWTVIERWPLIQKSGNWLSLHMCFLKNVYFYSFRRGNNLLNMLSLYDFDPAEKPQWQMSLFHSVVYPNIRKPLHLLVSTESEFSICLFSHTGCKANVTLLSTGLHVCVCVCFPLPPSLVLCIKVLGKKVFAAFCAAMEKQKTFLALALFVATASAASVSHCCHSKCQ